MYRQKGSRLEFDDEGLLKSGLLVRVLVLPNGAAGVAESLAWIAETLSPRVAISLMAQYYPIHRAADEREVRRAQSLDHDRRVGARRSRALEANGLFNGYQQELETANSYYRPDFRDRGNAAFATSGTSNSGRTARYTTAERREGEGIVCGPGSFPGPVFPARPAARRR